jgi:CO/xanthine dehydrogenase FAD-binding subunit
MTEIENYLAPTTIAEATGALAAGGVVVLAGGTDLMLQLESKSDGTTLMNVRRVAEMQGVTVEGDRVRIGALASVSDMMSDEIIAETAPVIAGTADRFASNQIRNLATIGGNICNASPAGDMIIPLMLLDADVELSRWHGGKVATRNVPLDEFFTGPGKSVMASDELLTAVTYAKPVAGFVAGFDKTGPRPALEISMVSVGIAGVRTAGGLSSPRVAYGSVGPTPVRGHKVEAAIDGQSLNDDVMAAALTAADEDVSPISDVRASDWYRRHLVRVMTQEVLNNVANG